MEEKHPKKKVSGVSRREFFKRTIITAGIATPIVHSFALKDLWAGPSGGGGKGKDKFKIKDKIKGKGKIKDRGKVNIKEEVKVNVKKEVKDKFKGL